MNPPRIIINRHTGEVIRAVMFTPEESEAALEYGLRAALKKDPSILDRLTELEQKAKNAGITATGAC